MDDRNNKVQEIVSLSERESLIRTIPGFAHWSISEVSAFATLMEEVHVEANNTIVSEGQIIDAIYIIANGTAEVTKEIAIDGKQGLTLIALLNKGEVIGLKDTELYSPTGIRTATVSANTSCLLLKINLLDFNDFLQQHPALTSILHDNLKDVLKMQLIKEAAPFAQLTNERIAWMANLIKQKNYAANSIIFNQDDTTDSCYMIYEGRVEITAHTEDGIERVVAVLKPGALFGEAALLTSGKRNATAKALDACQLLILDREMLLELTSQDTSASTALTSMLIERNHPIRRDNILFQKRTTADGQVIYTLKDPINNKYFQLNEDGWFIWQQLNGKLTLPEITQRLYEYSAKKNPDLVLDIIRDLTESGFVYIDVLNVPSSSKDRKNSGHKHPLFGYLRFSYFVKNADKKLSFLYKYFGFLLINPFAGLLMVVLALLGLGLFSSSLALVLPEINKMTKIVLSFVIAMFFAKTALMINPFIQAMAIKHYKHDIPHLIFSWQIVGPQLYVDNSDLLLASRKVRCVVVLSGLIAQLAVAAIFVVYLRFNEMQFLLWLSTLFIYLITVRAFDPMLDLEGYQLVTAYLDAPRLKELAMHWLTELSPGMSNISDLKNTRLVLYFFSYCLIYWMVMLAVSAWMLTNFALYMPILSTLQIPILILIAAAFILEMLLEYQNHKKIVRNVGIG